MGGNLLLYRSRIVVYRSLQQETLQKIHAGHQGIQRCCLRAQSSVWWPGLSSQINEMVKNCQNVQKSLLKKGPPLFQASYHG